MQKSSETVVFAGKDYLKINLLVKTLLHELWQLDAPGNGLLISIHTW